MAELLSTHPLLLVGLWLLVVAGAGVQHSIGIGFGLITTPLMLVIDPRMVPVVALGLGMTSSLLQTLKSHSHLNLRHCLWSTIARIGGVGVTMVVLIELIEDTTSRLFSLVFAGCLLLAVAMTACNWLRLRPTSFSVVVATLVSSVMGTLTSLSGPAMALLYVGEKPEVTRSHLSFMLLTGTIITLAALALNGLVSRHQLELYAFFLPALVVGVALSDKFSNRILRHFRPVILTLVSLAAIAIIIRTF